MAGFFSKTIEGLFFQSDRRSYWECRHFGLQGEPFTCKTADDSVLHGVFVAALPKDDEPVRGTVIFAHACLHNFGFNLPQISWLVPAGFNVVAYDPRGVGQSAGETSLKGIVEDARAVLQYTRSRQDVDKSTIILFGQGVGADAMARLMTRDKKGVCGIVLESMWATHKGYMLRRYGPGVGHLCAALLPVNDDPVDALKAIDVPIALVVPEKDSTVPAQEVIDVMRAAPEQREIWRAEGSRHLNVFAYPTVWRERFIEFATKACTKH